MTLAEILRIVRGQLGQVEFAKKIGSSQTGVSAYEKGQRKPDYETLIRVSQAFGVTLDWLLLGIGPMYSEKEKTGDASPVIATEASTQPAKIIRQQKNKTGDMSPVLPLPRETQELYRRMLELQERLLSLTEQNAELRLQLERRDMRIRELERENAGLREAQKGAAFICRTAAGGADAS